MYDAAERQTLIGADEGGNEDKPVKRMIPGHKTKSPDLMPAANSGPGTTRTDKQSLAIGVWLCTVPLVLFVTALLFDSAVAFIVAAVLFVGILSVCNVMCRTSNVQTRQMH